jgi:hypothetical protein
VIRLRWSDSGPENETNAYGKVVNKDGGPVICGHGGSMWLCQSCADEVLKRCPNSVKLATELERSRLTSS